MRKNTQRLHAADGRFLRHISDQEHNEKIASGECVPYYQGTRYLGIKFAQLAHEECNFGTATNVNSPTGLTLADMQRNAMGCVDTPKRRQVYKMREDAQARGEMGGKTVPAAIRCYGHDKRNKPDPELLGNSIDRSMSRTEQWPLASESNKAVTVVPRSREFPNGVVCLRVIEPEQLAALAPLAL